MLKPHACVSILLVLLLAGTAFAATDTARAVAPVQNGFVPTAETVLPWVPDRLLVKFTTEGQDKLRMETATKAGGAPRTGLASLDAALDGLAVVAITASHGDVANRGLARELGIDRWYRFDLAAGSDVNAAAKRLAGDPNLEYALPDLLAFPAVVPDDPQYADNWGHDNTAQLPEYDWGGTWSHTGLPVGTVGFDANADVAWDGTQGYGDPGVVIAILDSGVDSTHPDLLQVTGWDFGDGDSDPHDDSAAPGHGTACAGVAAAISDNNLGVAGVAGGSSIMPLKVSDSAGNLGFSYIIDALYYAADNGADVASMSFGAQGVTTYAPMDDAVTYAYVNGVTMLAATGNANADVIEYPAINPLVIGVGAASPCDGRKRSSSDPAELNPDVIADPNGYTCDGERWWGSSYGSTVQDQQGAVDIIAPTILPTTDIQGGGGYEPGNYSGFFNGTSCATPYAAGVCALIIAANPTFTPANVRAQLVGTAQDVVNVESVVGWDRYSGYGLVDAAAAVGMGGTPAPVAGFSASVASGCAPLSVDFTDLSTGTVDSWAWDFGDGGTDTVQNPTYVFTAPGTYDVSLMVSGPGGADTLTVAGMITVDGPPAAAWTPSATTITAGDAVTFTDASTGAPTAWAWDFGDGGTATDQSPVHIYTLPGLYTVSLIATNACGPDTLIATDHITVDAPPAPAAAFEATPLTGCAPLLVDFTDLSTGTMDTWAWDFGDGGTDTVQNPSYEYVAPGSYDVRLIVTGLGGADTVTVAGMITVDGPPLASFTALPMAVTAGDTVSFTDTSTGGPTAWAWDFGDGGVSVLQSPTHVYTTVGLHTVALIATNPCGSDTVTVVDHITVSPPPAPVAGFTLDPAAGCAPLTVIFTDASAGDIDTWSWSFGDGGQDTLQSPVHIFNDPGSYDVRLIVAGAGGVDTLTVAGAVTVETPVSAAFAVSDTLGAPPLAVTFTDQSTGTPTSWLWDFGDAATDTVASPVHTYSADGIYDVTLIVANGCSADTLVMTAAVQVSSLSGVGDLVPASFGLAQNYPNPFNPMTTIAYSLKEAGQARLEIYDPSGRRVAVLVDGVQSAGHHQLTWQPRGLASGVYFARFSAEGAVATRRLTLLK